jgi:hypothetical protein
VRIPVIAILASAIVACNDGPAAPGPGHRVRLDLTRSTFTPGEVVGMSITNLTTTALMYGGTFCGKVLQRLQGTTWEVAGQETVCQMSLGRMEPLGTYSTGYLLSANLAPGVYRIGVPEPFPEWMLYKPRREYRLPKGWDGFVYTQPFSLLAAARNSIASRAGS